MSNKPEISIELRPLLDRLKQCEDALIEFAQGRPEAASYYFIKYNPKHTNDNAGGRRCN
jgi:hypothetical protein